MKMKLKNILALILSAVMLIGVMPAVNVFAAEGEYTLLVKYNDGTTEDIVVNEENISEKLQAIATKEGWNKWLFDSVVFTVPNDSEMIYSWLKDGTASPDANGKYPIESCLGNVDLNVNEGEISVYTTINFSDVDGSVKSAIAEDLEETGINWTVTVKSYKLPDNKELTKENWLAYMNANPTVNYAPVAVTADITKANNVYNGSVTIIKADNSKRTLTESEYTKTLGELLDLTNYDVFIYTKISANGSTQETYDDADGDISGVEAGLLLDTAIIGGANVEYVFKELSDTYVFATTASIVEGETNFWDICPDASDEFIENIFKYGYNLDFTSETALQTCLDNIGKALYGDGYKVTEWALWGINLETDILIDPLYEINAENYNSYDITAILQAVKVEKIAVSEPTPDPETKPMIPKVVYTNPNPINVKANMVTAELENGKSYSLTSNGITKAFRRAETESGIYITAGNYRFVLPRNAVKLLVEKDISCTVEIDGIQFILDASAIEKVKAINFASIMKSSAYKELIKETDTIYVSITEKGTIKLSK